jgi:hypothetical protein
MASCERTFFVLILSKRYSKTHTKTTQEIDLFFRLAQTTSNMTLLYYYKKEKKERKTKTG